MSKKDSLGDRMKGYENTSKSKLVRRTPVIIRIDGKAFHTFTKRFNGSFNRDMHELMVTTTEYLCENVQNCVFGYTQSDEISLVLNDWTKLETDAWFGNSVQKMASVSASLATGYFNAHLHNIVTSQTDLEEEVPDFTHHMAFFDARVYNVPKEEVTNYFLWRQQDATRNSVQMLGRESFSHKSLHKKSASKIQDMLMLEKGINWNDIDTWKKRGTGVLRDESRSWEIDEEIPILTQDRDYINKLIEEGET